MPKPTPRIPAAPGATPALAPAEDNGVPYAERHSPTPASRRTGTPLSLRISEDMKARLVAVSEETGIPQSTLLRRALDKELKLHEG